STVTRRPSSCRSVTPRSALRIQDSAASFAWSKPNASVKSPSALYCCAPSSLRKRAIHAAPPLGSLRIPRYRPLESFCQYGSRRAASASLPRLVSIRSIVIPYGNYTEKFATNRGGRPCTAVYQFQSFQRHRWTAVHAKIPYIGFTRQGPLVRSQYRPPNRTRTSDELLQ